MVKAFGVTHYIHLSDVILFKLTPHSYLRSIFFVRRTGRKKLPIGDCECKIRANCSMTNLECLGAIK